MEPNNQVRKVCLELRLGITLATRLES